MRRRVRAVAWTAVAAFVVADAVSYVLVYWLGHDALMAWLSRLDPVSAAVVPWLVSAVRLTVVGLVTVGVVRARRGPVARRDALPTLLVAAVVSFGVQLALAVTTRLLLDAPVLNWSMLRDLVQWLAFPLVALVLLPATREPSVPSRPRRRVGDEGAGTMEYVAAVLIVGVLVVGVATTSAAWAPALSSKLCSLLRTLGVATSCTDVDVSARGEPDKPCVAADIDKSYEVSGEVSVVKVSGGGELEKIRLSDGTWVVRRSSNGSVDAELVKGDLQATATGNGRGLDVDANITGGGGLVLKSGSQWNFVDESSADAFIEEWGGGAAAVDGGGIPSIGVGERNLREVWNSITGRSAPSPDVSYSSGGVTIYGSGQLQIQLGISAGGGVSAVVGSSHDNRTGQITTYQEFDASGHLSTNWTDPAAHSNDSSRALTGVLAATYDEHGTLTHVELTGTGSSDGVAGGLTEAGITAAVPAGAKGDNGAVTYSFAVDDHNRTQVEALLAMPAKTAVKETEVLVGPPQSPDPTDKVKRIEQIADEAQQALLHGMAQQASAHGSTSVVYSAASGQDLMDVALGVEIADVGLNGGSSAAETTTTADSAYYLSPNGWTGWTACAS